MIKELEKYGEVLENVNLKTYNTYHVESISKYMLFPTTVNNLISMINILRKNNMPYMILGKGSNVIFSDNLHEKVIIKLDELNDVKINKRIINVEAGKEIAVLALETAHLNLKGLEWATGIPGTIGGAIVQNAGAYNSCIFDFVKSVTVLDENNKIRKIDKKDIEYSYRNSMFKHNRNYIILGAELELQDGNYEDSIELINDRKRRRLESQPLEYPSAGSVFRNPEGDFAGHLIEECGLKGYHINGAYVSEKHANFVINKDNATGEDVRNLIKYVHDKVLEKYNIDLILEQEFIGWD